MNNFQTRPLLNIRGTVVYPGTEVILHIGRTRSIQAINCALATADKEVILITQRESENNDPETLADMFNVGSLATITRSIILEDAMKINCRSKKKVEIHSLVEDAGFTSVTYEELPEVPNATHVPAEDRRELLELFSQWAPKVQGPKAVPPQGLLEASDLADFADCLRVAVGHFRLLKTDPLADIKLFAETGFGAVYQRFFDENKSYINAMIAARQAVLEESNRPKQLQLLRSLMLQELALAVSQ